MGRDTLSRVIYGARTSLFVAFAAVLLGTTVGSLWGVACGYLGGRFDLVSQRMMEILQSFPDLILAMAISMAIGTGMPAVIVAIAITRLPFGGRVIRSVALTIRELPYVEAARASRRLAAPRSWPCTCSPSAWHPTWFSPPRTSGWPSSSRPPWASSGVGIPPPTPTWGNMLADSLTVAGAALVAGFFPGLAITVTVLAFNLLGDGIRDALDPRLSPAFLRMMAGGKRE